MHNSFIVGWDIGGAHVKAALLDSDGFAIRVVQLPCPLWRGLDQLDATISALLTSLPRQAVRHALTMTGELADIFADRHSGVCQIAALLQEKLGAAISFYAGNLGFVSGSEVGHHAAAIASANWLASASHLAQVCDQALLIDIGSTTTDLISLAQGSPRYAGTTDAERMQQDELVYSGVVRTPLMALASRVPFAGEWQPLAAEHFATSADVYRLTGELDDADDMAETADGQGKTQADSARRLARMIGRDATDAPHAAWQALAHSFRQFHLNQLKSAAMRVYSRQRLTADAPIIGAGVGSFLARELARQLDRQYVAVDHLIQARDEASRRWAAGCLPAYAVARLAWELPC